MILRKYLTIIGLLISPLFLSACFESIEGFKNGALESTTPATTYNRVREAVVQNGETFLILEGGVSVSPSEVSALRDID